MAHDWEDTTPTGFAALMSAKRRKCRKCGAEQTREAKTWYMRIVGYQWFPKAGRCTETARERLRRRRADTAEGQRIVSEAYALSRRYPEVSEGQLLRLAYWGRAGQ